MIPGDSPGTAPGVDVATKGSWWGLVTTMQLARDPGFCEPGFPLSCPNDGTLYRTGPTGQLYCPWDGFRPGVMAS